MTTFATAHRRLSRGARALLAFAMLLLIAGSMLIFQQAAAEPAHASNRVCTRVAVPPSLPWYRCTGNVFTPGAPNSNPAGCYTTYKVTCSG